MHNILLTTILSLAGIIFIIQYYFLIFKRKQNEKAKTQRKGGKVVDIDSDKYAEIIDDYPTYDRNK